MTANLFNQVPYLRTSREFPDDPKKLILELNKSYLDTANAVNNRTIGIFTTNNPVVTGESWFINNSQRNQSIRRVYTFTTTAAINHGINVVTPTQFSRCFGDYTDGTNSYGLFWATSVAIAGQITFYLTSTQIIFVVGGGAPALTSGKITLEWLSQV